MYDEEDIRKFPEQIVEAVNKHISKYPEIRAATALRLLKSNQDVPQKNPPDLLTTSYDIPGRIPVPLSKRLVKLANEILSPTRLKRVDIFLPSGSPWEQCSGCFEVGAILMTLVKPKPVRGIYFHTHRNFPKFLLDPHPHQEEILANALPPHTSIERYYIFCLPCFRQFWNKKAAETLMMYGMFAKYLRKKMFWGGITKW